MIQANLDCGGEVGVSRKGTEKAVLSSDFLASHAI